MTRLLAILSLFLCIGCGADQSRHVSTPDDLLGDLLIKSTYVNSADAIIYGEYRVEMHEEDLVHPKWKVTKDGRTVRIGRILECLEDAFTLSERDR